MSGPVLRTERIDSLDVLRGFAVLGILVMNIQSFSMYDSAYFNPTVFGEMSSSSTKGEAAAKAEAKKAEAAEDDVVAGRFGRPPAKAPVRAERVAEDELPSVQVEVRGTDLVVGGGADPPDRHRFFDRRLQQHLRLDRATHQRR